MIETTSSGVRIRLRVQPRAARTEVAGVHGDAVRLRVAAAPVDGAANTALVHFLAERLGVPRSAVHLLAGVSGRSKVVAVDGVGPEEVRARLGLSP